jgi:hypothetical protein
VLLYYAAKKIPSLYLCPEFFDVFSTIFEHVISKGMSTRGFVDSVLYMNKVNNNEQTVNIFIKTPENEISVI